VTPLRVLIVDDEPLARTRLRELLDDDPAVSVVAECGNGRDAVTAIQHEGPDVVLLDIQMPEMDGFGVVRAVGAEHMPAVVFVTASDAHAVRAFEVHAVDYVLKPVDRDRFAEAMRRAKERVTSPDDLRARLTALVADVSSAARTAPAASRLAIRTVRGNGRVLFIRTGDIDWCEAMDNHLRLHVGKETYVIRETLTNLEQRLPAGAFLRVHRSSLVNVDRIREIQPWFGGDYVLILTDGTKVTTGRRYRAAVQTFLERSS
jgi:two-component system, LytTR family, response regulator